MSQSPQNPSPARSAERSYLRDKTVLTCLVAVFVGFTAFLIWASVAPLKQGVTAQGTLIDKDRRRTIQHLEGGIIETIAVHEGQSVLKGDVLMTISDATGNARFSQAQEEVWALEARLDRLEDQLAGKEEVGFERLDAQTIPPEKHQSLTSNEIELFNDERTYLRGEEDVIRSRIARLHSEQIALQTRKRGKDREIASLRNEFDVQTKALKERMGNISRVNEATRLLAVTETELANLGQDELVTASTISETQLELLQVSRKERARLSTERAEAQNKLSSLREELSALIDRMSRRAVIAPIDGIVIDLKFLAPGAVIGPGDPIMDLVPSRKVFILDVRFAPSDRDDLIEGRTANIRFGTLNPINPPVTIGVLQRVAPDATYDVQTKAYYYTGEIAFSDGALDALSAYQLSSGIPAEVFFAKNGHRTPMSYFFEPVLEMLRYGMRS